MEMIGFIMAVIVVVIAFLLIGLQFFGGLFRSITVYEYERALKYQNVYRGSGREL